MAYIERESPDFVGIQEALHNQVTYLSEALEGYDYVGVGRDDGQQGGEFMALFYNKTAWRYLDGGTFWLSSTPETPSRGWDAACHRVCTYGVFVNKRGDTVSINNTHLDHIGKEARAKSVEQLLSHMREQGAVHPAILLGDFNFEPDSPLYEAMNQTLSDAYMVAKTINAESDGTFNGFNLEQKPMRRIDYVWLDTMQMSVIRYAHQTMLTPHKRHMSDHLPVLVEIHWKPSIKSSNK